MKTFLLLLSLIALTLGLSACGTTGSESNLEAGAANRENQMVEQQVLENQVDPTLHR